MSHVNTFIKDCHRFLADGSLHSDEAKKYLIEGRGLTLDSIAEHSIGFFPRDKELPEKIRHFGEEILEIEGDAELENKKPKEIRDFYYRIAGKIIVPIYEEFGCMVGFATRSYLDDGTTWWNVPLVKGNHLFLFNKAKKAAFQNNKIYLVEGYMDALLMYQYGIKNVAAIMGTSLTLRQLGLIMRYCSNVCFCFDTDENQSGQKATSKSVAMVNKFKTFDEISTIQLPVKIDPDSYIIEHGKENFLSLEKTLSAKQIKKISQSITP